jgi:hypothetical protein
MKKMSRELWLVRRVDPSPINDKGQPVAFYANTDRAAVNGFLANPVPRIHVAE